MGWSCVIYFSTNVSVVDDIPVSLSGIIDNIRLLQGGVITRYGLIPASEDENLAPV